MICPECGCEYREGFLRCSDCDVDLVVPSPPELDERTEIRLVQVFEGGNPAIIPLVESVLDEAGIEFSTSSENLQDLFGGGRLGGTWNFLIGPVKFFVREEDEQNARAVLAVMAETLPAALPAEEEADT